jgi:hypothetical protein
VTANQIITTKSQTVLDLKQSLFSMFSGGDEQRMMVDGGVDGLHQ